MDIGREGFNIIPRIRGIETLEAKSRQPTFGPQVHRLPFDFSVKSKRLWALVGNEGQCERASISDRLLTNLSKGGAGFEPRTKQFSTG